jgi:hypothetical protein
VVGKQEYEGGGEQEEVRHILRQCVG